MTSIEEVRDAERAAAREIKRQMKRAARQGITGKVRRRRAEKKAVVALWAHEYWAAVGDEMDGVSATNVEDLPERVLQACASQADRRVRSI